MQKYISYLIILALLLNPAYLSTPAYANWFTTTFGGSPVSPSDVAYAAYSFGGNFSLSWPRFSAQNPNVAARFMNMTATTSGLNVNMPDATLNSTGYDTIIFNSGANSFNVVTLNGNAIVTIAPGQTYYLMLTGNGTQDGTWLTVQFGVGTSSVNASALAGAGLLASGGLLNVNLGTVAVANSFSITSASRAVLYVWTGGAGTMTLPNAGSVGAGFAFAIANNGSGSLTATPASGNIDGNSSSVFSQTQSGFIISNGTNWYTVGKGIQNTFAVTLLNLNVAGSSNVTETSAQAQNIIQQFTGALTGNINVIVPNTVQMYIANNLTSGAYTLTVKTAAGTGIQVVQGSTAILYCDGTNVVNAFTAQISGTISVVSGSAASPSISIQGSAGTGIYSPAANQVAFAANGAQVLQASAPNSAVNFLQALASATGSAVVLSALGSDTNIGLNLVPKGSGTIQLNGQSISLGGTFSSAAAFTTAGANPLTLTTTGTTNVTLPVSGTLLANTNNLSDISSAATSRTNLGLGTAATQNTGTSGATIPLLNGNNTFSGTNAFGVITSTTPAITDNSTKVATTAFVKTPPTVTVLTSGSGTYTTPSGVLWLEVKEVGGGGGGGGSGASGGGTGGTGSSTTFGSLTANGGAGSAFNSTGGAGGTATGGSVNLTGASGRGTTDGANLSQPGGAGGNSYFGGGGNQGVSGGVGESGQTNSGGGGQGGGGTGSGSFEGGGGGAGGYVDAIIASPSATYSYSVGSGGSPGAAGAGGQNGGAGGSGIIEIIEHYTG